MFATKAKLSVARPERLVSNEFLCPQARLRQQDRRWPQASPPSGSQEGFGYGHETTFAGVDYEEVENTFKEFKPDIVAYTTFSGGHIEFMDWNRRLKSKYKFYAMFGGPHVTFSPEMIEEDGRIIADWEPMIRGVLDDMGKSVAPSVISARFHNTLAEIIDWTAIELGEPRVVLTGGCFQNRYLAEEVILRLRTSGLKPYWHQRIPTNDGGIALGQIAAAAFRSKGRSKSTTRPLR